MSYPDVLDPADNIITIDGLQASGPTVDIGFRCAPVRADNPHC